MVISKINDHDRKYIKILLILLGGMFCLGLFEGIVNQSLSQEQKALSGVLNLENISWQEQEAVQLRGEWIFYPDELVSPGQVRKNEGASRYIELPGTLSNKEFHFFSARLKILLTNHNDVMMFKVPFMYSAYRFFVNGELVSQAGTPAMNREDEIPLAKIMSFYYHIPENIDELDLLIQVSSFHHTRIGQMKPIVLGTPGKIMLIDFFEKAFDLWVIFNLLFLFLFFLMKMSSFPSFLPLSIALFFLVTALRMAVLGDIVLGYWVPGLNYEISNKIAYITTFLPSLFIFYILWRVLLTTLAKRVVIVFSAIIVSMILFVLFFQVTAYVTILVVWPIVFLLAFTLLIYELVRNFHKQIGRSIIVFLVFFSGIFLGINDFFHFQEIFVSRALVPFAFFKFWLLNLSGSVAGVFYVPGLNSFLYFIFLDLIFIVLSWHAFPEACQNRAENFIDRFKKYGLSTREQEVAALIISGYSNQQAAERLFISLGTVKLHVHRILSKCKVKSRTELSALFIPTQKKVSIVKE